MDNSSHLQAPLSVSIPGPHSDNSTLLPLSAFTLSSVVCWEVQHIHKASTLYLHLTERTPKMLKNHYQGWSSPFAIPELCPHRSRHSTNSLKRVLYLPTLLCNNSSTPHQIIMCTTCTQHLINKPTTGPFHMSHLPPFPWQMMC